MNWTEISIETASTGVDMLCALLMDLGIKGFVIQDSADFNAFLEDTTGRWDYIDQDLMGLTDCPTVVTLYLPENEQGAEQLLALRAELEQIRSRDTDGIYGSLTMSSKGVREEDWANNWKQYFKPFTVGEKLLIKPSWEECPPTEGRCVLEIDPASSFGTGQHHTTRLCLELLETILHPDDRVLDLGCGSGILSIAALLLGASDASAIDIAQNAADTARENAQKNHINDEQYAVYCGDVLSDPALCDALGDGYHIITANIVADVLIGMSDLFPKFLVPNGKLIVSGIIVERKDEVLDAIRDAGFTLDRVVVKEGWAAALLHLN